MVEYLSSVSLADLAKQQEGRAHSHEVRETKVKAEIQKVGKPALDKADSEVKKKPLANSVFTFAQQIN
jgi:Rrf2 family iron-sulfur cluster assembly transcriptional regulator